MSLTQEQKEKIEEDAVVEIERRRKVLREIPIRGHFTKEVMENILFGMKLRITKLDFVSNTITFKLDE